MGFIYQLTLRVVPATFTEDLVARASHEAYRGPRKFLIFGERKNDGNHNEQSEFLVASPF